jgi:hypothetical protein
MTFPLQLLLVAAAFLIANRIWNSFEIKPHRSFPPGWSAEAMLIRAGQKSQRIRFRTALIVSAFVLVAAAVIILGHSYSERHLRWAYVAIGMIVGFWLKPEE